MQRLEFRADSALQVLTTWQNLELWVYETTIQGTDTTTTVRHTTATNQRSDTLTQASSALVASHSAEATKSTEEKPLLAQSKKKGLAWLCPIAAIVVLLFFVFFLFWMLQIKKN